MFGIGNGNGNGVDGLKASKIIDAIYESSSKNNVIYTLWVFHKIF